MAPIIVFSYLTQFSVQNCVSIFWRPLCLYFTAKTLKYHFYNQKQWCFIVITFKTFFKIPKNTDTVLNCSYLAIKLPNFKTVDEKLFELETWVSHSFDIKNLIVSRKKLLKVLASPQAHFWWIFLFQNLILYMRYHNIFFRYFKALPLIYPYGSQSHFGHFLRFQFEQ